MPCIKEAECIRIGGIEVLESVMSNAISVDFSWIVPQGNVVAILVSGISQILGKPALVADEDGGVVVIPVIEGIAASPSVVRRVVRPLRIGRAGAVDGEQFQQVGDSYTAIKVDVSRNCHNAFLIHWVPDRACAA